MIEAMDPLPQTCGQNMQIYTLTEIMHQRGEKLFCEVLNRLRTADLTEDDVVFESHIVKKTDSHYLPEACHFFPLKTTVRNHNEAIYASADSEKMAIHAYDFITGKPSDEAKQKCKIHVKTSKKYIAKHDRLRKLNAAVGLAHITSVNVKTDDGLINGAPCILKKIQFIQRDNDIPGILWVLSDDKMIGRQWRDRYWNLYTKDINQNWTPIFVVDRHFKTRNAQVIRNSH